MNSTGDPTERTEPDNLRASDSPDRLAQIASRVEAATPGPWVWAGETSEHDFQWHEVNARTHEQEYSCVVDHGWQHEGCFDIGPGVVGSWGYDADGVMMEVADATFIAHAREDVPYLLARVRELEGAARDVAECGDDNVFASVPNTYIARLRAALAEQP